MRRQFRDLPREPLRDLSQYPRLTDAQLASLRAITPSHGGGGPGLWPVRVELADGSCLDPVLVFFEAQNRLTIPVAGVPMVTRSISLENTCTIPRSALIAESRHRLPAAIADAVYGWGETSMGGYSFVLRFGDRLVRCDMGGIVDLPELPEGLAVDDIDEVIGGSRDALRRAGSIRETVSPMHMDVVAIGGQLDG